jgi:glycosyltransferase involved in cell wall biosynthesis
VQTCVSILQNFPVETLNPILIIPKSWVPVSKTIEVIEAIPRWSKFLPYKYLVPFEQQRVDSAFNEALQRYPSEIAYFWPTPPIHLVRNAQKQGSITVREMINTPLRTAKAVLDEAYERIGIQSVNQITERDVEDECEELHLYDYIFASNGCVEKGLADLGIEKRRILRSSFGWSPHRFGPPQRRRTDATFRALFVGHVCVRKGAIQLIEAWKMSGVDGELLMVGDVEPAIRDLVIQGTRAANIRLLGFVSELGSLYDSSDVFVFPTLEEGGPQVTYEAAGRGLPVVTTPMGSARLVEDGRNGFIVQPYDIEGLARSIRQLFSDRPLRQRLASQAAADAQDFAYERVGVSRAHQMVNLIP